MSRIHAVPLLLCISLSSAHASALPEEIHLGELTQLTFGGENAEAYWSFDGQKVILQRRAEGMGCDQIYTLDIFRDGNVVTDPAFSPVSNGKGATTCAYFLPGDQDVLFASTHLGGEACPPKPDMRQGYVWALYDSYDIFTSKPDGSALTRLTDAPGYDAEATVCGVDGSILFTSVRDGDIELYRMDADGANVVRLTHTPGYDGGAFFSADCSQIVWRASRPKVGKELDDFQGLLKQGLVRPSKLEIYVANADGSNARQITYLDAASFAPFFFPDGKRVLFSTNYQSPGGRDFDLWAVNTDGTDLERITHTPGFDGFPMFSPDGQHLIFASNRATAEGKTDTNLFLARWQAEPQPVAAAAAERLIADAEWLADPAREGRGIGTRGLEEAGAWLEARMQSLGLQPAGADGSFRAPFPVVTSIERGGDTALQIADASVVPDAYTSTGWSAQGAVKGDAVLAGWAMQDAELGIDDFAGVDVKGKIVIARRFVPEHEKLSEPAVQRRAGDLRKKAFVARNLGATALIVVDWPVLAAQGDASAHAAAGEFPPEAALPSLRPEGSGDAGLPVLIVKREALSAVWPQLEAGQSIPVALNVQLLASESEAFNVIGRIPAGRFPSQGTLVLGAHYDHLGYGGPNSLAPDKHEPHLGADDNASGTAVLLEVARQLQARRDNLPYDIVIASFSAEESGVLGSNALVQAQPDWLQGAKAMLNFDMVGRLRDNQVSVMGTDSAPEWAALVEAACQQSRVHCRSGGDGYGPSDHMPFYTAGMPVAFFFTGAHDDYHKPSDSADKLNAIGMARISEIAVDLVQRLDGVSLSYAKLPPPDGKGDARSFNASLGTVPNYGGPPAGVKGVLLDDVRPGGGAEKAGMRRGDIIVRLGKFEIGSIEDLLFVLMQSKPGETVTATVLRDGQPVQLETTFQEGKRR
jgi:Tol biopolymer transport system component